MPDPLLELCQIFMAKLRDEPNADQAQLVAHLKSEIAANPKLAAAIQTDSRISQINMTDPIEQACQIWAEKLREDPRAEVDLLVNYLKAAVEDNKQLKTASQANNRLIQTNKDNSRAYQTWIEDGATANFGTHYYLAGTRIEDVLANLPKLQQPANPESRHHLTRRGVEKFKFIGREAELQDLHEKLQQSDRIAIAGMGGIGKTELALQYAIKHRDQGTYPGGICWLEGSQNRGTQVVDFVQTRFGLVPARIQDLPQQISWCWQRWRESWEGLRLVIYDNVHDYREIEPYLPPTDTRFKVLLTTRKEKLAASIQELKLEVLTTSASLELLRSSVTDNRIDRELQIATQICQWLGFLPLAVELIGKYLVKHKDLLLEVLWQRLQNKRLEAKALQRIEPGMTASLSVIATFELSWQELNIQAQELARLLSLFTTAPIPWKFVKACLPDWDEEDLDDLRDEQLGGLHLLKWVEIETYQLHPLVREFFATKLNKWKDTEALQQSLYRVMAAVAEKIPRSPTQHQRKELSCAEPHIIEVATTLQNFLSNEDLNEDLKEDLTKPYVGLARLYISRGIYKEAERWYEKCKSVVQNYLGSQHKEFAAYLNNLGSLYIYQGRYDEALPLLKQALDLSKQLFEENHLHVARALSNLASLHCRQRHFDKAQPLLTTAIEIMERGLEKEDSELAVLLNNLAGLYSEIGIYQQAESILLKTLKIATKIFVDEHPDTASYMNNLAHVYQQQGHFDKSELFFRKVLEVRKKLFGEEDLDVAESLNNLGIICAKQMRYGEAIPLLEQAIEISRKLLGDRDPLVEKCRASLKNIQDDLKNMWDELEFR